MKELVSFLAKHLVDHPDEVDVKEIAGEKTTVYELRVNQEDLGKVIGKSGRTARAIRTVLNAASIKDNKRVSTGTVVSGPTLQRVSGGRAAFLVVVAQRIVSEGSNTAPQSLTSAMLLTVSTAKDPRIENVEVL